MEKINKTPHEHTASDCCLKVPLIIERIKPYIKFILVVHKVFKSDMTKGHLPTNKNLFPYKSKRRRMHKLIIHFFQEEEGKWQCFVNLRKRISEHL